MTHCLGSFFKLKQAFRECLEKFGLSNKPSFRPLIGRRDEKNTETLVHLKKTNIRDLHPKK